MAGSFRNNKDSIDISELASLNEDISDDMIEKLQQKLTQDVMASDVEAQAADMNDDSTLFEEINQTPIEAKEEKNALSSPNIEINEEESEASENKKVSVNKDFDDNFIKKYKAKLKNKQNLNGTNEPVSYDVAPLDNSEKAEEQIETLSQGNISEKPITPEIKEYNDSLDFLDGNVKYSKYVMYIDPENVDFIESLTVKERKNLINRILRQQDDIAITKKKFRNVQGIINHIIVAILTLALTIPIVYYAINASLEATINNHRNAQTIWQTLYKEHGKITQN